MVKIPTAFDLLGHTPAKATPKVKGVSRTHIKDVHGVPGSTGKGSSRELDQLKNFVESHDSVLGVEYNDSGGLTVTMEGGFQYGKQLKPTKHRVSSLKRARDLLGY